MAVKKSVEFDELEQEFEEKPEPVQDSEEEDEMLEEEEKEELSKRQPLNIKKVTGHNEYKAIPQSRSPAAPTIPQPRKQAVARFTAVKTTESYSIVDTETNTSIMTSDTADKLILAGITDIMSRLDSLERNLG